ncbi:MAG: hypothetical protein KAJ05_03390 [Candidatus Latescibacteria bacterium]|nr:hypothetical protein [Candidatus Latescibacterota bacterium]MCK5526163.1 hypothetical protein [Candidatus Latescibacterota bacterium]
MTHRVVVTDTFYSIGMETLTSKLAEHDIEVDVFHPQIEDPALLADYDAVVVQHHHIGASVARYLDPARCKLIARMGVGYDEFDLPALTEQGIRAANVPGYGPGSVGQHTLEHILSLAGHGNEYHHRAMTARDLDVGKGPTGEDGWTGASRIPSLPLSQSVLGIVGFGRIGKKVAELAGPFFGSILVCDPYLDQEVFSEAGVKSVGFDELLETADVVTVHVPSFKQPQRKYGGFEENYRPTEQFYRATAGLIGAEEIAKMKTGAFLINTARGGIVRESAVIDALIRGKLAGVGLDVFEEEPFSRAHPLRKMAGEVLPESHPLRESGQERYNITLTFHSAYYLKGVFKTVETLTAEEIVRVLVQGELPHHLVNPAVLG